MSSEVRRTKKRADKTPPKQLVGEENEDIHADEDEAGISESGLQKIMQLLGEDGLNEADVAALEELRQSRGEEDEEESEEDEDEEDEDEEDEEEEEEEEEDEESEEEEEDEEDEESEEEEDEESEEEEDDQVQTSNKNGKAKATANSSTLSAPKDSLAASILRSGLVPSQDESEEEDQEEDQDTEEDEQEEENQAEIALDDLPDTLAIPEEARASKQNRVRIQNDGALSRVYEDFRLDKASGSKGGMPWIETMSVSYPKILADEVPDVQNDLEPLDGAVRGRSLVLAANVPFSRPDDYFAEMVKTDEHMERIRQRLLDESASIQASEKAKRQRELKKYGKQVQTEKLQERQKNKREMEDKVSSLKRKRGGLDLDDDEFDVQLEEALDQRKQARNNQKATHSRPKMSRTKRDDKYGFGGKKKYNKSNDAQSLDQFDRRGKGGHQSSKSAHRKASRPGKSRRAKGRH